MKVVYTGENDARTFKDVIPATISALAAEDPNYIYLDADLMNCIGTVKFAAANPDQGIDCGIAEANMVGVACGLAAVGFKPVVHTFGPFASRRCFDQVFLSGGYAKNDITVLGSDPGVTAALNGGTHMPFEDVALYRTIPGSTVIDVTDPTMFCDVLKQCKDRPGVKYLRFPRKNAVKIYSDDSTFQIGKGNVLREGKDLVIIACGLMVGKAMAAAEKLAAEGIDAAVIDMFSIKPLDEELVVEYAKKTGAVVVAENHNKIGGLYSAVCDVLAKKCPTPVEYVAIEDEFGEVGPQSYLEERFALTADHVEAQAKAVLARK